MVNQPRIAQVLHQQDIEGEEQNLDQTCESPLASIRAVFRPKRQSSPPHCPSARTRPQPETGSRRLRQTEIPKGIVYINVGSVQ